MFAEKNITTINQIINNDYSALIINFIDIRNIIFQDSTSDIHSITDIFDEYFTHHSRAGNLF